MAAERGRAPIPEDRHEWRTKRQPLMRAACHRLVFLDETSVTTKMTRLRGRSRKGTRLHAKRRFGHWGTQTFIAGLRWDRLSAPWVIDKAMNRAAFEAYVETQLAPTLNKGDVVILDNLAVHKSPKAAACLKQRGAGSCSCRPTRPTSIRSRKPSPSSRLTCARPRHAPSTLSGTPSATSAAVRAQECRNFLKAKGYASD